MKTHLFSLLLILFPCFAVAQVGNDPVIMTIDGKEVKKSEFDYIYNKNNKQEVIDTQTQEEYIELFKNFKLKVCEAEAQGLDTTAVFRNELAEYRFQLAQPYLKGQNTDVNLLRREYDRMNELVEISHILLLYPEIQNRTPNPRFFPKDTLALYQKVAEVEKRLKKGESFEDLADQYNEKNPSQKEEQPGYLGWFPGMTLHTDMEDVVFNTPIGKVSDPVRMTYGYHFVKVLGKKPNPGEVNAAHILINCPEDADVVQVSDATEKINEVYQKIMAGEDFAKLAAEYSQDPGSASNGGNLDWFGYRGMVKEFRDQAFALTEMGEVSQPFRSQFGFHIVKLLGKRSLPPFEEEKDVIETKLARGGFLIRLNQPGIATLKNDLHFRKNESGYNTLMTAAQTEFPISDEFTQMFENNEQLLFSIEKSDYTIADFIAYLQKNKRSFNQLSTDVLDEKLAHFEYQMLKDKEEASLEDQYPEFRNIMKEYRDGILMFEISNKEVWNKASEDTEGLEKFFEANKDKYTWNEPHFKGYIVFVKDEQTKKKMQKDVSKMNPEEAVAFLKEKYNQDGIVSAKIDRVLAQQGENEYVDEAVFKTGKAEPSKNYPEFFVIGNKLLAPESHADVKGLVITDYQDFLEKEWIKNLNRKYSVKLFPEAISSN